MMTGVLLNSDSSECSLAKRDLWALLLLFLLALALRLIRLFDLDLNFDEVVLLFRSQDSFVDIWNNCKTDNFPPLYPWLVKIWMSLASGDHWYRLFGALLGSLTPPAAYLLGREIQDKKLGWYLGIASAFSVFLIFHSQFVRMFNVQTLLACLSFCWFLKALRTNQERYWLLVALANLVGFYVYIFMILLVLAEFLVLLYYRRLDLKAYVQPALAHLPFLLGVLLWMTPALQRYALIQQGFWIPPLSWKDVVIVWLSLGAGAYFRGLYALAAILNLLFLLGFVLALALSPRKATGNITAFLFAFVIVVIGLVSLWGQSFFHIRYVLFVLPLYLALALYGWMKLRRSFWRKLGLSLIFATLACSLVYYFIDYYWMHEYYGFIRPLPYAEANEGHALSLMAADVADRIKDDEVIIHFSDASYFASLYYHRRSLKEYFYCKEGISQFRGRQYLKPGEWIRSLSELIPMPKGVWMVTFGEAVDMLGENPPRWVWHDNLPAELRAAGYQRVTTLHRGNVTAVYFRRNNEGF